METPVESGKAQGYILVFILSFQHTSQSQHEVL
jgi:hypothetical protein